MVNLFFGKGQVWAIAANAAVFILFLAFLPYRRGIAWKSKGAFAAFILALMADWNAFGDCRLEGNSRFGRFGHQRNLSLYPPPPIHGTVPDPDRLDYPLAQAAHVDHVPDIALRLLPVSPQRRTKYDHRIWRIISRILLCHPYVFPGLFQAQTKRSSQGSKSF